jgi:glyoxylase-like metal-dependent hydrolase (beta-lactamase superfamily II)
MAISGNQPNTHTLIKPVVQAFFDPATFTITYLVSDPATKQAVIIDPVLDYEPKSARTSEGSIDRVLKAVDDQGLELRYVLETHAHADHLTGAHVIAARTGARIAIGARITDVQKTFAPIFAASDVVPDGVQFDLLLKEGDQLDLGELKIEVLHTPGHTPACVTFVIGDAAFVGDTLFMPDYGIARTDFPGGDAATLYASIQKILALPDDTRIFVGHDYLPEGRTSFAWETTVGAERAHNVHVGGQVSQEAFVAMRNARDKTLAAPTLILPSLQVNIRAGQMPPPDANGTTYLRLPVNVL